MEFIVNFKKENNEPVASLPEQQVGLEGLDEIRAEKGSHILPKNLERKTESRSFSEIRLKVSEETARISGLFAQKNLVDVFVQKSFSDWFFWKRIDQRYSHGEYQDIFYFSWDYDYEKISGRWKKAGYPKNWDINC